MKTIREIFRIGYGPSSSHTMGPRKAAELFKEQYDTAARYQVHLYGSLSATGKGHLTDAAILDVLPTAEIVWHDEFLPFHPNGMRFCAWDEAGNSRITVVEYKRRSYTENKHDNENVLHNVLR